MKRTLLLAFAILSIALAQPNPQRAGMDAQRLSQIPVRMKEFVDKGLLSGAVTLIARHGVVAEFDAVGWQNVEAKQPMRKDSIFQIMSMTKPFTGAGIMMLAEEGRLRLVDPVEKHLPEFRGQMLEVTDASGHKTLKKPARVITIADLMTHTSGMKVNPSGEFKEVLQKMDRTLGDAVAFYGKQPLDYEPGSKWQYSNMGLATLGRIIEVVSGQPYEKFIQDRLLTPLEMKDSFFFPPANKTARMALLYKSVKGKLELAGPEVLAGSSANFRKGAIYSGPEYALCSTATDLMHFYQMMLNGGKWQGKRILSRAAVDVMTATHTGDMKTGHIPAAGRGLTWETVKNPEGTLMFLSEGSFGHGGAFGTHGWIDKKRDLVGVFLVQSAGGPGGTDAKYAFMQMAAASVLD